MSNKLVAAGRRIHAKLLIYCEVPNIDFANG